MTASKICDCGVCGGAVLSVVGPGRTFEYRPGIHLDVPEDFPLVTCQTCKETYLTSAEAEALEAALEKPFERYCREQVDTACEHAGVSLRELARAAGVTYLEISEARAGKTWTSLCLLRLVEIFTRQPDELHRHLREPKIISVAADFSKFPAGRYRSDGPYSGQAFKDELLVPALRRTGAVRVLLDGTMGYGSSFLEEAFGGLIRENGYTPDDLEDRLTLEARDSSLIKEVWGYVHGVSLSRR